MDRPHDLPNLLQNSTDPIIRSLKIPIGQRTKKDLLPIIEFVRGLKFFHSFSVYPQTVEEIAECIELTYCTNGHVIFSEGEPGDLFYIILDGEVSIFKKKKVHQLLDFVTENVLLVKLGCGRYFGETALESSAGVRTASAIASKVTLLLTLTRLEYQRILSQLKILLRVAVMKTLSSPSSIFNHVSAEILEKLSELVVIRSFTINEIIYPAKSKLNSLMVVKSGIVKITKGISKYEMRHIFSNVESRFSLPPLQTFEKTEKSDIGSRSNSPGGTNRGGGSPKGSGSPVGVGSPIGSHHGGGGGGGGGQQLSSPNNSGRYSNNNNNHNNYSHSMHRPSPLARVSNPTSSPGYHPHPSPHPNAAAHQPPALAHTLSSHYTPTRPHSHRPPSSSSSTNSRANTPATRLHRKFISPYYDSYPPGYWILTRSDEFLAASRPYKMISHDGPNGAQMITEITRGSIRPGPEEIMEFVVAVLMPGQLLGEGSLLDNDQTTPNQAMAATAVELYCFDSELCIALGIADDSIIMKSLLEDWKFRNPPQKEILKQLAVKYTWEKKKTKLMTKNKLLPY